MDNQNKILFVLGIIIGVSVVAIIGTQPANLGAVRGANVFSGGVTNSSTTVSSSTATSILTRDTNRLYAVICNDSTATTTYLQFSSVTTTVLTKQGYRLEAEKCYEIDGDNLYLGAIWGIADDDIVVTILYK